MAKIFTKKETLKYPHPIIYYRNLWKWIDSCKTIEQLDICLKFYTRFDVYNILSDAKIEGFEPWKIQRFMRLKGQAIITNPPQ